MFKTLHCSFVISNLHVIHKRIYYPRIIIQHFFFSVMNEVQSNNLGPRRASRALEHSGVSVMLMHYSKVGRISASGKKWLNSFLPPLLFIKALFFVCLFVFQSSLGFTARLRRRYKDFSSMPYPSHVQPPLFSISPIRLVHLSELTNLRLTYHYHPQIHRLHQGSILILHILWIQTSVQ